MQIGYCKRLVNNSNLLCTYTIQYRLLSDHVIHCQTKETELFYYTTVVMNEIGSCQMAYDERFNTFLCNDLSFVVVQRSSNHC